MTITFLFPNSGAQLSGGLKVVCEYANRLAADGHDVHIAYAGSFFWAKKTWFYKLTGIVRYFQTWCKGYSCQKWFALDNQVMEHWCWSLNERHVPKSNIYICSTPYTAMYLNDYKIDNYRKFYFIQGFECWGGVTLEKLYETYHYPLQKIAVAEWLQEKVMEIGETCEFVPNGFDFKSFRLLKPISNKDRFCISMYYSTTKLKGCDLCFKALDIVHNKYPQIHVNIFGSCERPEYLPQWYIYYCKPDKEHHNQLYNESAIYIGCSFTEGWCLTIGEAMSCGCAVACSDIPGYRELAKNNKTALLSPVGDSQTLAENIIRLIEDDDLRFQIAQQGYEYIQQFSIEKSYRKFREAINA